MPMLFIDVLSLLAVAAPFVFPLVTQPVPSFWQLLLSWFCIGLLVSLAWCSRASLQSWARRLAWGLLLAALLSASIGLLQYFGLGAQFAPWVQVSDLGQAQGNLRQRNQLATLLTLGAWALLWLWFEGRSAPTASARSAARAESIGSNTMVVALAVLAMTTAATASRTGTLQCLLLTGLLALWWRGRDALRWGAVFVLVYGLAAWLLPLLLRWTLHEAAPSLFERLLILQSNCASRRVLWSNVLHLISLRPWSGWGWNELDYAHYITLYEGERFCDLLDNAHNLPLQLAVELGLPLALLACGLALWLLWRAKPWRETVPARQLAWGALGLIGLHSLLEYPLWYGPFQLAALYALVLLWPQTGQRARRSALTAALSRAAASALARAVVAVLTLGLTLVLCGYLLWDYHRVRQLYLPPDLRDPRYRTQTLSKVADSRVFADAVNFAIISTTPLNAATAQRLHALALKSLHFSPEPLVIQTLIESACILDRKDEAAFHALRFRAAYAQVYARWRGSPANCTP